MNRVEQGFCDDASLSTLSVCSGLELWFAYPSDLTHEPTERVCFSVLDGNERERASRFLNERHRREYVAAHALVRHALSYQEPRPAALWLFRTNAYGKPAVDAACDLQFNLSSCEELAVCLVGRGGEVGVDAEPFARGEDILELKDEVFSPAELTELSRLHRDERPNRALSLWVLKEAYAKARGVGLTLSLRDISFLSDDPHGIRLQTECFVDRNPEKWRFCLIDLLQHRVAIVVDSSCGVPSEAGTGEPCLECFEARAPLFAPKESGPSRSEWFPRTGF